MIIIKICPLTFPLTDSKSAVCFVFIGNSKSDIQIIKPKYH